MWSAGSASSGVPHTWAAGPDGAGVAFLNADFELTGDAETEVGYNLFAGLEGNWLRETSIRPFVEARWTSVEEYDAFRLNVGFNVPVSRR